MVSQALTSASQGRGACGSGKGQTDSGWSAEVETRHTHNVVESGTEEMLQAHQRKQLLSRTIGWKSMSGMTMSCDRKRELGRLLRHATTAG